MASRSHRVLVELGYTQEDRTNRRDTLHTCILVPGMDPVRPVLPLDSPHLSARRLDKEICRDIGDMVEEKGTD